MAENTKDQIAFLRGLRAVRSFRPDPVPQEALDDILQVARWSGSASNRQAWSFLVLRDRETLQKVAEISGPNAQHAAKAPLAIVLVLDGDPERVIHETYDDGRLAERIMLGAEAYGLGSCIGWFRPEPMVAVKDFLGIPQEKLVRTIISIGYPNEDAQRARTSPGQARKPLRDLVHYDRY